MNRRFRPFLAAIACVAVFAARPTLAQNVQPFRFLHITDTHVTATTHDAPIKDLVAKMAAMSPRPAFVIHTGDVTELGRPEEFAKYLAAIADSPVPFHTVPGNHDVRWSPLGKQAFTDAFKARYSSFNQGGVHFALLDSTIVLEHSGHFDGAMLKWLEKDLKKLKKGAPVVLAFHHWVGRTDTVVDNEHDLLQLVAPYNVVLMLIGHGHSDVEWKVNGIQCVMAKGLYQGSYHIVDVEADKLTVSRVTAETGTGAPRVVATIPLKSAGRRTVGFAWDTIDSPLLARRRVLAELRVDGKQVSDSKIAASYRIDGGAAVSMPVDKRDTHGLSYIGEFDTTGLANGAHNIDIELEAPDSDPLHYWTGFVHGRNADQPSDLWDDPFATGDTIQGSPNLVGDTLYVGSFDGKVYALNAATGKQRWSAATKGAIYSTPTVADGRLFVGSMDRFVYGLDARTGHQLWKFDTGSPLFASAAVAEGVVCIGGNKKVYGLDAATGAPKWQQDAGGFFQSRAAAADGVFYLGAWDNTLYGFEAASGRPKWTAKMGRTNGGRGDLSFYYSPAIASPTAGDGKVYVCTDDGVLHAVNAATGKDDWIARAPSGGDVFGYSSPLYAEGRIYVGGLGEAGNGDCYALDAKTGAPVWRCKTGADNYNSSPALCGSAIVIGSLSGRLSWIDRESGQLKRQYALPPGFAFSTPAASDKAVYQTSMNGNVYAVKLP